MHEGLDEWPSKTLELPPAWPCFVAAAAATAGWLACGVHLVGMLIVLVDPVVVLAFSGFAIAAIRGERRRGGLGLSARGLMAGVALVGVWAHLLTLNLVGGSSSSEFLLEVVVRDGGTGRPIPGAVVAASTDQRWTVPQGRPRGADGEVALTDATADARGRAFLYLKCVVERTGGWVYAKRAVFPSRFTLAATAASYSPRRVSYRPPVEYRPRLVGRPFREAGIATPAEVTIDLDR